MRKLLTIIILVLLTQFVFCQVSVKKVTGSYDPGDKQGVFYALPSTWITVDLAVQKTEYIAGPYAEYAAKYLDLEDVITSNYDEYTITDVKLGAVGVPDPNQIYFANVTDKTGKEGKAVLLALANSGMIMDLRGNLPDQALKNIASLDIKNDPKNKDIFSYFAETNLYEKTDTIIHKVVVDTVTVEKVYLDRKWVEKTNEQKAVEAANKISKIRDARYNLLTGYQEIAYPSGTVAYMDQQLQKMEKEYLSLFTGIALQTNYHYTFSVKPEPGDDPVVVPVCLFSERSGIKDPSASGGEKLNLRIEQTGDYSDVAKVAEKRNGTNNENQGYFYRIPVVCNVSLSVSKDLKADGLFPISQFGTVTYLPPSVTSVQFYKDTGGIKAILAD